MSASELYVLKYQQLLRELKSTVEGLLVSQVVNVWSIYGGLSRLHRSMEKIFKHGCKSSEFETVDYFDFIHGLEWLQPETCKFYFSIDCEYRPHLPQSLKDDKASIWLYRSLENHSLSQKLSWLLSDQTHLSGSYHEYAFLRQQKYAEATMICLKAVERNQASLISEIDPCLLLAHVNAKEFHKLHRRCSSFPDDHLRIARSSKEIKEPLKKIEDIPVKKRLPGKLKPWNSEPNLRTTLKATIKESKTTPNTPVRPKRALKPIAVAKARKSSIKKSGTRGAKQNRRVIINNCDIIEHTPTLSSSQGSGNEDLMTMSIKSLPEGRIAQSPRLVDSFWPLPGEKDIRRTPKKSFFDDGGMGVLPMATGYFPRPKMGQSLMSFLSSNQFGRATAELDRENAHFRVSEAIISAMEQIRCKRDVKLGEEQYDSDPEIMDLKQRIRLRRREKLVEKQKRAWAESLTSDTTTVSPCSTTPDTLSECTSSEEVDDLEVDDASTLSEAHGLSASMASLYSEADVLKRSRGAPDGASDVFSAEGVALSLISKFSERVLPRASDLEWLVSEEDAPQALLPMPKSWPVSPNESPSTPLRGTQEWAPPRAQIIFTVHSPPSRKLLMTKQNYRCAGCSMKVAPQYASKFRYCHYLGRYFCTGCHTNQLALVPGRILQKWDFTRYPVSTFSYRLLDQMYVDPLFRVFDFNKNIGKMSKNLQVCRKYRHGLFFLKDFMFSCRYAETIVESLHELKTYILTDPEMYSIEDLVNVRSGEMKKKLKSLVEMCCKHASECKLCLARGFICEVCQSEEVIFPWQMKTVSRCNQCGSCYHTKCCNPNNTPCKKCNRISKRRESSGSCSVNP